MNEKYVVFPRAEVEANPDEPIASFYEIEDAVVIRRQDIFAAPAFYEYAGQINTTVEILEQLFGDKVQGDVTRLREIADYFITEAEAARLAPLKKLPD